MTKVFMVRHGQSISNIEKYFTGSMDIDLSDLGRKQALYTAKFLSSISFDALYSSDRTRAYETGLELSKIIGVSVLKNSGFNEIFAGDWEGLHFEELNLLYNESYSVWLNDMDNATCDGGESIKDFRQRVKDAFFDVAHKNEGGTICIFTHATPIRSMAAYALGKAIQDVNWPANSSVSEFLVNGNNVELVKYGYNDFLGELITKLPTGV